MEALNEAIGSANDLRGIAMSLSSSVAAAENLLGACRER